MRIVLVLVALAALAAPGAVAVCSVGECVSASEVFARQASQDGARLAMEQAAMALPYAVGTAASPPDTSSEDGELSTRVITIFNSVEDANRAWREAALAAAQDGSVALAGSTAEFALALLA